MPTFPGENWVNYRRDTGEIFRFAETDATQLDHAGPIFYVAESTNSRQEDIDRADLVLSGNGTDDDGLTFVTWQLDNLAYGATFYFAPGKYYFRSYQQLYACRIIGAAGLNDTVAGSTTTTRFMFTAASSAYLQTTLGPSSTIPGTIVMNSSSGGLHLESIDMVNNVTGLGGRLVAFIFTGAVGADDIVFRDLVFTTTASGVWSYLFANNVNFAMNYVWAERLRNDTVGVMEFIAPRSVSGAGDCTIIDLGRSTSFSCDNSLFGSSLLIRANPTTPLSPGTNIILPGVAGAPLTNAHILVGNASNVAADVAASGDVTLANTGAFTVTKIQNVAVKSGLTTTDGFVLTYVAANSRLELLAASGGGGSSSFADNVFFVTDDGDATKKLAFEVSGVTTGTTRTLTVPNLSGTITLLTGAQTLDSKTLTNQGNITFDGSTRTIANTGEIDVTSGIGSWTSTGAFTLSSTGLQTITTSRASATAIIIRATGSTGNILMESNNSGSVTIQSNGGGVTLTTSSNDTTTVSNSGTGDVKISAGANKVKIQNVPIEPVSPSTGHVLKYNGTAFVSAAPSFSDSLFAITDNGDATKVVAFEASGITTATTRTLTVPNKSGTIALTTEVGVIGLTNYDPGSLVTTALTTTSKTKLDTTNLTLTFTAPLSGNVLVEARIFCRGQSNVSGTAQAVFLQLVDHGTTTQRGNDVRVLDVNETDASLASIIQSGMFTANWYLTGLTAGTSYTVDLAAYCLTTVAGLSATIFIGGGAGSIGAATMVATACP